MWDEYTRAMEELGASGVCDVFAHPDLVKVAGRVPAVPDEFYDRITEAAVRSGMAAELSSAGWRKPVGEEYPAPPLLQRFVERGVPLTTASDAHTLPDVADRADDLRDLLAGPGSTGSRGYRDRRPYEVPVALPAPGALTVATPAELAFERTNLDEVQLGHLQRLLGTWGILADLSFSDLVLLAPMAPLATLRAPGGAVEHADDEHRAGDPGPDAPVQQRHRGRARPGGPDGGDRPTGPRPCSPSRSGR